MQSKNIDARKNILHDRKIAEYKSDAKTIKPCYQNILLDAHLNLRDTILIRSLIFSILPFFFVVPEIIFLNSSTRIFLENKNVSSKR